MAVQANRKPQHALAPPKKASNKTAPATLAAAQAAATEAKQKRKRTKQGCITCRVRGKKCDEVRNDDGTCNTCNRLRIHCLGFVDRRPEWLRTKENIKVWRKRVTDFLLSQGFVKGYAGCGLRSANVPERRLTLEEMREDLGNGSGDGSDDAEQLPLTPRYAAASAAAVHHAHHPQHHNISARHGDAISEASLPQYYSTHNGGVPAAASWQQQQQQQHPAAAIHHHHQQYHTGSDSDSNGSPPRQTPPLLHHTEPYYAPRHPTPITSYPIGKDHLGDLGSPYSPPYSSYTTLPPLISPPLQYNHYVTQSGLLSGASLLF